ncbi:MAG TPA: glycosyltransferase family 39 protein [Tepidisphaeraceae bacterium]|nr:glycosyltransferase family 39 protein [Tepidisphaeraceae bacterium]
MPTLACAALLAAHAALLALAASRNSATFDEPAHLAAGVEYWRHHDFSIYCLSPPLLRLWGAIPATIAGADSPATDRVDKLPIVERHWIYSDAFVAANFSRFPHLLVLCRLWMIPISCAAGWMTCRWAWRLYGARSAVAACAMYCLNPSILAHGSLVTTDVGTMAAMLAACWLWWKFCRSPSLRRWSFACAAVLAAHLCKFSAVLLWPMLLGMAVPFIPWHERRRRWVLPFSWLMLGIATLFLLNAVYGFRGTGRPLGSFDFESDVFQNFQRRLPGALPSPVPRLLLLGFDAQKRDTQGGYEAFLFGDIYRGARFYYFPAALLCKLPVAMLLLLAAAAASALGWRGRAPPARRAGEWSILLAVGIFSAGVMLLGDLNIGTRYLLPALPLAIVLISRIWAVPRPISGETRSLLPYLRDGLLAMLAIETLWVCPRFLTFVNFAVGGASNGWRLLSDSDYDWGQGLIDLRDWMQDQNVPAITLAYFGHVDPAVYGINFYPIIHPGNPEEVKYVGVSAYFLDGLLNRVVTGQNPTTGEIERANVSLLYSKALQAKTPVAVVGNTIFIYRYTDVESAAMESIPSDPRGP